MAGTVTGLAEADAETPLGNSFTLNVTEPLNPPTLVIVSVLVTVLPSSIVNEAGDTDNVKFFVVLDEVTVSAIVVLAVVDPDVPVIVTVADPTVADDEAVSVSVEVAVPPDAGVTGFVENAAVTPLGNPEALSVVAESNPFTLVTVMVLVPLAPCLIETDVGDALTVKLGVDALFTVSDTVVVAVRLPDVPVIVTVAVPVVAEELAVRLSALVPVVGFVPNAAVTPLGKPEAAKVTLPVNPSTSFTVIVLVPADPPCVIDTLLGEAERVKLGDEEDDPDSSVISPVVFGLPHPVHRSKPFAAE